MNLSRENIKKIFLLICLVILFYCGVQNIGSIFNGISYVIGLFLPFILGGTIAFIINVPMRKIEAFFTSKMNKKFKKIIRPLAYLCTLVLVIGVISLAIFVIVPEIAATIVSIAKEVPTQANNFLEFAKKYSDKYPELESYLNNVSIDWNKISSNVYSFIQNIGFGMISSGIGFISGIIGGIATFFIGFAFSIYVIFQKEKLQGQAKQIIYALCSDKVAEMIIHIGEVSHKTFSNFLAGQCLEAVILGTMFFVTLSIARLPYALLIGFLIAITALIPIVGAFLGCVIGALLILMISPIKALIFIVIFFALQQIEGNLIYPHVVGNSVGLPSIWVLVAVTLGGKLMGVFGILIFIPLCSVIYALFREFIKGRLDFKKIPADKLK